MKKFPINKAVGRRGVAFVEQIVGQVGSIFREFPEHSDLGIDGLIEFVEKETTTAELVAVQIKAGPSYFIDRRGERYAEVVVTLDDLAYWERYPVPVVLIVCDPTDGSACWLDIKGFISRNLDSSRNKRTRLTIPLGESAFTTETLLGPVQALCQQYRSERVYMAFAELLVSLDNRDRMEGFIGLSSRREYLFSKVTCFLFFQHLFCENEGLRAVITDSLSRYLAHPEVGFNPPKDIRTYVKAILLQFGQKEIAALLDTAWLDEENFMQRGSLGQSVGVLISAVPSYTNHLERLVFDPTASYHVRVGALALVSEFDILPVLEVVAARFDSVDWGEALEAAKWILEYVFRMEIDSVDLDNAIDTKGDNDSLAELLSKLSILFLCENESSIVSLLDRTTNRSVQYEASRALERVARWKRHPEKFMQRLV